MFINAFRTHFADSLCIIFTYRKSTCDWFGRLQCSFMGSIHRNTFTCTFWPQRLGFVRRMGSSRTKISYWRTRWPCKCCICNPSSFKKTRTHSRQVRLWDPKTGKPIGDALKGHTKWVTSLAWEPVHLCVFPQCIVSCPFYLRYRNPSAPRLASSSKDGTVRVWATATRRCEYTLGGHTASVNVVRWGGGGLNGKGVLYTASSDRTVRVWDSEGVGPPLFPTYPEINQITFAGKVTAHPKRSRSLGDNVNTQYRLRLTDRPIRPYRQKTVVRCGRTSSSIGSL